MAFLTTCIKGISELFDDELSISVSAPVMTTGCLAISRPNLTDHAGEPVEDLPRGTMRTRGYRSASREAPVERLLWDAVKLRTELTSTLGAIRSARRASAFLTMATRRRRSSARRACESTRTVW